MSNVTANANAAFITYNGTWDIGDDSSERVTSAPGASASVKFSGTAVYVYGQLSPPQSQPGYNLSIALDGGQRPHTVDNTQSQAPNGLLYFANVLDAKKTHTVDLALQSGMFNLSRIVWTSSTNYTESDILVNSTSSSSFSTLPAEGGWIPQPVNQTDTMCTWQVNASITFNFTGNGIAIQGRGSLNPSTTFQASVDNKATDGILTARAPEDDIIDLYRIDGLNDGSHNVTLRLNSNGTRFCVSKAKILARPPTSTSSVQPPTSSSTTSSTPYPFKNTTPLSGGPVAGIVIAAFLVPIIAGAIIIFYRRRRQRNLFVATRAVKYERLCSKCGKPITDDYRLECVDLHCPAEVDLHVGCADWNTPERHTHEVHQVPNK